MDASALEPDEAAKRKLHHILRDFAPSKSERRWVGRSIRVAVHSESFAVPELAIAALKWVGFNDSGPHDKTAWCMEGRYRNTPIALASTKFGLRVFVDGPAQSDGASGAAEFDDVASGAVVFTGTDDLEDKPELRSLVDGFISQIMAGAKVFDRHVMSPLVDTQVTSGNVTLMNQSERLRGAYNYFRWQAQAFLDGHGEEGLRRAMTDMGERAASQTGQTWFFTPFLTRTQMQYCLTAMATAYFSWLEHVLVLSLPFGSWEPEQADITKVISSTWTEKWALVIPASIRSERPLAALKEAAEEFRHLDVHGGFGKGNRSLLVHTPMGALPARLTSGARAIKASVVPEAPISFADACEIFDATDTFLRSGPLSLQMRWIDSGLQVPFDAETRRSFRDAIAGGPDAFEVLVATAVELEDRMMNFDY